MVLLGRVSELTGSGSSGAVMGRACQLSSRSTVGHGWLFNGGQEGRHWLPFVLPEQVRCIVPDLPQVSGSTFARSDSTASTADIRSRRPDEKGLTDVFIHTHTSLHSTEGMASQRSFPLVLQTALTSHKLCSTKCKGCTSA